MRCYVANVRQDPEYEYRLGPEMVFRCDNLNGSTIPTPMEASDRSARKRV
jgi:hypothetical protein